MKTTLRHIWKFLNSIAQVRFVALGYTAYVLAGWVLLCVPISQTVPVSPIDNLFTAVSALSTTGLATVSTGGAYSFGGQLIILLLIQVGGIGYMTFGSFVVLSHAGNVSDRRKEIARTVFSLPMETRIEHFLRSVIIFTVAVEFTGSVLLYFALRAAGMESPVWPAVFHSVSTFCTAGFSLYDNSMEYFRFNPWINVIIAALSYLGAIGFIVVLDAWRTMTRQTSRITLTSKVILVSTFWLSVVGTGLFFLGEPSIQSFSVADRLLAAGFQTMSALTTVGFNTISMANLSQASLFLLILLMIIGASPSGTGGGLKTTTFSAVTGVIRSAIKGLDRVYYWGKEIPPQRVWVAFASLGFYLFFLIVGCYVLAMLEPAGFEAILFEVSSALGTVGLSTGITASLTSLGKLTIVFLMFIGRLGPLAFGMSLFLSKTEPRPKTIEDLAL